MQRVRSIIAAVGALAMISACAVPGDAAIKLTGNVADEEGGRYSECAAWRETGSDEPRLISMLPRGQVDLTVVFQPLLAPTLRFTCTGTTAFATRLMPRMPARFETPADLGTIVVPRK